MKKWLIASVIVSITVIVCGVLIWTYIIADNALKHETSRWAVIKDINGDRIAVEPTSDQIWTQLAELYQNQSTKWIGSFLEIYDNKWGFRFKPENITVAETTVEGAQATIKWISEDLTIGRVYTGLFMPQLK
jgi:hypothetical protein